MAAYNEDPIDPHLGRRPFGEGWLHLRVRFPVSSLRRDSAKETVCSEDSDISGGKGVAKPRSSSLTLCVLVGYTVPSQRWPGQQGRNWGGEDNRAENGSVSASTGTSAGLWRQKVLGLGPRPNQRQSALVSPYTTSRVILEN